MPFYYKILNSRKKVERAEDLEENLQLFLAQQNKKQNYRNAGVTDVEILYKRAGLMKKIEQVTAGGVLTSYPYGVEVVSQAEIPLEFLCDWGKEVLEGPRAVTRAKHFFMLKSIGEKPTFEECRDVVQKCVGSYTPEIELSSLDDLPSVKSKFPGMMINVLSDGAFVGYTCGNITDVVRFYEHFSRRARETGLEFYLSPKKANTLSFE